MSLSVLKPNVKGHICARGASAPFQTDQQDLLHHKKTDLKVFVVVVPKEGLAG